MRLLEQNETIVIILGASNYTRAQQPDHRSLQSSRDQLAAYVSAAVPNGLGIDQKWILSTFNDPAPAAVQLLQLREVLLKCIRTRDAEGLVTQDAIILCIGLGLLDRTAGLHLMVQDTSGKRPVQTSISLAALARTIDVALPKQRRLVLLDCAFAPADLAAAGGAPACHDAIANTALQHFTSVTTPADRGLLVWSSAANSDELPAEGPTAFTAALMHVLSAGIADQTAKLMSCADVSNQLRAQSGSAGPGICPVLLQSGKYVTNLLPVPAFPNNAEQQKTAREAEEKRRLAEEQAARERQERRISETQAQAEPVERANDVERVLARVGHRRARLKRSSAGLDDLAPTAVLPAGDAAALAEHGRLWWAGVVLAMLLVPVIGLVLLHNTLRTPSTSPLTAATLPHTQGPATPAGRPVSASASAPGNSSDVSLASWARKFRSGALSASNSPPSGDAAADMLIQGLSDQPSGRRRATRGTPGTDTGCNTAPASADVTDQACSGMLERWLGIGVSKAAPDHSDRAAVWVYEMGAEQGELAAQLYVGNLFATGTQVPLSPSKARHYYSLAAQQGSREALSRLATLNTQAASGNPSAFRP